LKITTVEPFKTNYGIGSCPPKPSYTPEAQTLMSIISATSATMNQKTLLTRFSANNKSIAPNNKSYKYTKMKLSNSHKIHSNQASSKKSTNTQITGLKNSYKW
jgi:hypothetical protein